MVVEHLNVKLVTEQEIITNGVEDLKKLTSIIYNSEDVILSWIEKNIEKSELFSNLAPKVKNGDLKIKSEIEVNK